MSSQYTWVGDVFLSFRGPDTRWNFADHLYAALSNAGFSTFRDTEELQIGEDIDRSLFKAIEGAKLSIVVFSKQYANSRWCLNELVHIMKCRETKGQIVFPVFYHVAPSDLRNKTGTLWKLFQAIVKLVPRTTVSSWQNAIAQAANIPGYHIKKFESEAEHIQNIVRDVSTKIDNDYLVIADHPVGIESHVSHVWKLMRIESDDVRVIGIWGMEGIGKTTIAKAVYNELRHRFEGKSFLFNIKDCRGQFNGLVHLQEQLLSNILLRETKIQDVSCGKVKICKRLNKKKVLIVLDDIDNIDQMLALCGDRKWFGRGSRLLITTSHRELLDDRADEIYSPSVMTNEEALKLFRWCAFREEEILDERFIELSEEAIRYCGGLPLAVQIIGSYLSCRKISHWEEALRQLRNIPHDQMQQKLRISFDGLPDEFKRKLFLDICCFFIGMDKNDVVQILADPYFSPEVGLDVLEERCLITIGKKNDIQMHDLVRDMGREIVRGESTDNPEKRSRLWFPYDVQRVLRNRMGTEAIEGIALTKLRELDAFEAESFVNMTKLRLLLLSRVKLTGDYEYLSKGLKLLYWHKCPLRYIPSKLDRECLVSIDLRYSKLKLVWKDSKLLENLKIINVSYSLYLIQTPDFSKLPNLQKLILKHCTNLRAIHETIVHLKCLVLLNLKGCKSLGNLPRNLYKSKSLKILDISHCRQIDTLEEDIVQMVSLTTLIAHNTSLKKLPFSIVKLRSLSFISLRGYSGSARHLFSRLIWFWMFPRDYSQTLSGSSGIVSSQVSSLWRNSFLKGLSKVYGPWLERPLKLQPVRDLARALNTWYSTNSQNSEKFWKTLVVHIGGFNKITTFVRDGFLQGCYGALHGALLQASPYKDTGPSVCFEAPLNFGPIFKGFTLSVASHSSLEQCQPEHLICAMNHSKGSFLISKLVTFKEDASNECETWQHMLSDIESGDRIEFILDFGGGFTATMTEVRLVYCTKA